MESFEYPEPKISEEILKRFAREMALQKERQALKTERISRSVRYFIKSMQHARKALAIALREESIPADILDGMMTIITEGELTLGDYLEVCATQGIVPESFYGHIPTEEANEN